MPLIVRYLGSIKEIIIAIENVEESANSIYDPQIISDYLQEILGVKVSLYNVENEGRNN